MSKKEKNKIYIKAINYFNNGEIEKAIIKCEDGISSNLANGPILNLKGLLLYLKGDLNGAVTNWKINSDFNDDETAKSYIRDAKKDSERLQIYRQGETLLKKMLIDEAIDKLTVCLESDFNSINVNCSLALCYLKKGEYSLASVHVTRTLEIDRNNIIANKIAKELKDFAGIELALTRKSDFGKKTIVAIILMILIMGGVIGYKELYNTKQNTAENELGQENSNPETVGSEQKETTETITNEEEKKGETKKDILVSIDVIEEAIKSEKYDLLYEQINPILDVNKLSEKEKAMVNKGIEVLETKGTEYYYKKAVALFKENKFDDAKSELIKGYTYGKKSYLYPHEMFYLGSINEKLNNTKEAITYYENYYNNYKDGPYIETVIYSLAILNKEEDFTKSKKFATELRSKYPKSIYNNEVISNLLK